MMQEFVQRVKDLSTEIVNGIHTAIPGKIVSFDPSTGQAVVSPSMMYRKPDGSTIAYPNISGVPVMFPQAMGQTAAIAYPIKPGDGCLIISAERALDYWMYGQETETDLSFDLTNSICIPGLFKEASAIMKEACENNAIVIDLKGTKITVHDEYVRVDVKEPRITARKELVEMDVDGTRITVKNGLVQIDAAQIVINGDTTVNGSFTTKGGTVNLK